MQYKDAVEVVQFNVDVVPHICFWSWKHLLSLFLLFESFPRHSQSRCLCYKSMPQRVFGSSLNFSVFISGKVMRAI